MNKFLFSISLLHRPVLEKILEDLCANFIICEISRGLEFGVMGLMDPYYGECVTHDSELIFSERKHSFAHIVLKEF